MFVRVTPMVAWVIVIAVYFLTALLFISGEGIISGVYAMLYPELSKEAVGPANILRTLYYVIPILFDIFITVWAFLVTTRRQVLTREARW